MRNRSITGGRKNCEGPDGNESSHHSPRSECEIAPSEPESNLTRLFRLPQRLFHATNAHAAVKRLKRAQRTDRFPTGFGVDEETGERANRAQEPAAPRLCPITLRSVMPGDAERTR